MKRLLLISGITLAFIAKPAGAEVMNPLPPVVPATVPSVTVPPPVTTPTSPSVSIRPIGYIPVTTTQISGGFRAIPPAPQPVTIQNRIVINKTVNTNIQVVNGMSCGSHGCGFVNPYAPGYGMGYGYGGMGYGYGFGLGGSRICSVYNYYGCMPRPRRRRAFSFSFSGFGFGFGFSNVRF